jgi:hypothetical protein
MRGFVSDYVSVYVSVFVVRRGLGTQFVVAGPFVARSNSGA